MSSKNCELFAKAAEVIATQGWVQRVIGCDGYGYCALGAVSHAAGLMPSGAIFNLSEAFLELQEKVKSPIAWWNDAAGRTKEQVIDVLKELACS